MRIRWGLRRVTLVAAVLLFSLMMTLPIVAQQRQARPAGPAQPTPRRADGTVNLGRPPSMTQAHTPGHGRSPSTSLGIRTARSWNIFARKITSG